ncbi:Na+/H+ antiporter NhaC family protein [Anaerovorax odorimutans]|uniref:Na+/H+ antiporter NhaC family protein n=1 Tax=Anaerovorax odorimutans TaxID=109327 RepID=A0ABT1RSD0_9FIRM|nr:Na+/H+ antiporter NhaC family protein [Anaerovorax odorimutans]MCQ4638119.1 Na+/H+ antiporter NhaC family protein [Anaerovorax odorimutans]
MDEGCSKDYKAWAFLPLLIFLGLYVGCGVVFTIMGRESPFEEMPRYVAVLAAIAAALIFYERKTPVGRKLDIYCKGAGSPGVMLLGIIVLLAGGFSSAAEAMGGKESIVNMGLTLIPHHFLIPGIFIVTCFISTCIGTSMGTQVAFIPVAVAVARGAGLDVAMAGAAVIAGSYFGDNLSMISDTTICATKGVGAKMKDKFQMNLLIALPAAVITIVLYGILGGGASSAADPQGLSYHMVEVLPYVTVLATAIAGLDVFFVLLIGIMMTGIIGIAMETITFFEWTRAIGAGMEDMFFLAVFSMLIAGLIELIKYYGGLNWLFQAMTRRIKTRKSCEYLISLTCMALSGTTLNNPVAIIITAPVAKELGEKYRIPPKRLASLLDIFSCIILMLMPHDSGVLLAQQYGGVTYLEIMRFSFYPILLLLFTCVTIQFGLLRGREEKRRGDNG